MADLVRSRAFHAEMRRFLPQDTAERTLDREEFVDHLGRTVRTLLEELAASAP